MKKINTLGFVLIAILSSLIVSCGGPKPEPAPDIKNATEAPLTGSFYLVGYQGPLPKPYISHKLIGGANGDTDWSQQCTIPLSDFNTPAADIECYIEAHELDLYARGLTISSAVPAGLCEYFVEEPYYYFKYLPGVGNPGPLSYSTTDPICAFDYTSQKGPNCCTGLWTMSPGADPTKQPPRDGKYTGDFSACYSAPNLSELPKSEDGIPEGILYGDSIGGVKISRDLKGRLYGGNVRNTINLANYYLPSDHTHPTANPMLAGNAPIAFDWHLDTAKGVNYPTNPFFKYTCYDTNREVRARITLSVREWNTIAELHQGGNPNLTGVLPNGDNLNDYFDWKDFGDFSNTLFPQSNE